MPLTVRQPEVTPEPADREHVRTLVERAVSEHTQWNAGQEARNVDVVTDALMLLLDGLASETGCEIYNLRSEGMKAALAAIDLRLVFVPDEDEAGEARRYDRSQFVVR